MDDKNSYMYPVLLSKSNKSTKDKENNRRQEFWNGTLVDDYNYLMSEELICRCKGSLNEPFTSLNDLSVHHVSYNEFEKQYGELSHWCEKIYETITKVSTNALTRYLRQRYYEELYDQGIMRLRMFGQYADKLNERFPDLKSNIHDKIIRINQQWNLLESCFIDYLDENFDRIIQDLHNELILFEEWLSKTEEQLWTFESNRYDDISLEDFQFKLHQHTTLHDEIKSRNSRVSSIIEICERLKNDYEQQAEQVPFDIASDLENRWHQTWLNSVEIQCKLEERLKIFQNTTSLVSIDEDEETEQEEEDIIPFNSSEYEKIPLTPLNSSTDSLNFSKYNRKRPRSPLIEKQINNYQSKPFYMKRKMATSKRRMSLNILPINSSSTFYYSLTNINDIDNQKITKKQKKPSSKLDIGYESEDENNHLDKNFQSIYHIRKSHSDYLIGQIIPNKNFFLSLTHSLPLFEHNHRLPTWWRHSITSAYDTCSNPDIDFSIEETKKQQTKPSLLMYSKKYTKFKRMKLSSQQQQTLSSINSHIKQKKFLFNPTSNSYDASAEYTDPEQSENDVDILSSDFNSTSPVHHYQNSESQFYNRYTTTTTGYSSDIELETTTTPSETEDQQIQYYDKNGEVLQMKNDTLTLPSAVTSDGFDSLHTIINEKFESSEPCWDGYQNPLFYRFNSQDMDSIETTLKWEDQFLEMDQPKNSSSDDEIHLNENFKYILRNNGGSSSSLTGGVTSSFIGNQQVLDSDSDLDDFNYVLNETERQLYKARQSLDKKKRQQPFALNDRNLRKYDEVLRTCETNIQCLQQILKNLHRSKNSRLNSTKAIEQLQTYLSDWHDMRQQVNDDRIRARQLLYISQEIIKLKIRLDEELSHIDSIYNRQHPWLDENSLIELMRRINYELESEEDSRQKLAPYRTDILLAEEHLNEYRMSHLDGPSSSNIDEHLHNCRLTLEQLTNKMDTYQTQLRTLLRIVDSMLPIETQIEQKLTACEYNNNYQIELQNIQKLIDKYEEIINDINYSKISTNNLSLKLKTHCEYKLDLYKKMLNEFHRKTQSKHVSFDGSINLNNNNSSTSQFYTNDINQNIRRKKSQRTETYTITSNDINQSYLHDNTSTKQSSTSSYISDDCKVLYIETVIEVAKPVFYERTNDTSTTTTTNRDYHYNKQIPQTINNIQQSSNIRKQIHESSDDDNDDDDDVVVELNKPVNLIKTKIQQQVDSGIEYDHISLPPSTSSSTIFNQQIIDNNKKNLLLPSIKTNSNVNDSTFIQRYNKIKTINKDNNYNNDNKNNKNKLNTLKNSYCNRLKQIWLRSLLLGLFLLFILFLIYFYRLDTCSRSTIIRTVSQKIISVEHQGLPTI
ncbi:unnamed protein product [Rotaria sordida]|uniref:KASH domain-containing protein n=2 Tax=Rotaria sordida TaxID=392033 RepID=A0A813N4U0_9BILA|nr:unnamed protein product [Rotaria sordida]